MELLTLDSSFQPQGLVENYESLIWTERYSQAGDFELHSSSVQETMLALPRESFVALRDSPVVMVVEDHKIDKTSDGAPTLTVTGRSFETVLERRAATNQPFEGFPSDLVLAPWPITSAKESDAAYEAIRTVIGDFPRYQAGVQILDLKDPAVSPFDSIPEIELTLPADYRVTNWSSTINYAVGEIVANTGALWRATQAGLNKPPTSEPTYWTFMSAIGSLTTVAGNNYEIKSGDLYSAVMELLNTNHRGIKSVRPDPSGTKVGIEIYNGANLTGEGDGSDPDSVVLFDARFDQFDSTTYLFSERGSTNIGYVYDQGGSDLVLKTTALEPSGLARRVLMVDQRSDDTANTPENRTNRGLIELYKYNATALFDGELANQYAAGYNTRYFLGDIVKLVGEYGLYELVRIAEFIRITDNTGEKAYPTFEVVNE